MGVEHSYKAAHSRTTFIMRVEGGKPYLLAEGECSTDRKVIAECDKVRGGNYDVSTVDWLARSLANEF